MQDKVNWTSLWSKKYPVLVAYQHEVDIEFYAKELERLLIDLEKRYGYTNLNSLLISGLEANKIMPRNGDRSKGCEHYGSEIMDGVLKLNDLLGLTDEELSLTKIRLNTYNGNKNPIDEFKINPKILLDWNYWNNKPYRVGQISIGLVNMGNDRWLLFTVGRIKRLLEFPVDGNDCPSRDGTGIQVEYETYEKFQDLYGRVVLGFHNDSQQVFRNARPFIHRLTVKEILPTVFTGFDFPGYDNVSLSYGQLATIVLGNYPSYWNALHNQKAVYLQTDKKTGKLYVGSATAQYGMLLQRWKSYVENGHGGNVALKSLVEREGFDYIKENFQYTIIENFNAKVDDAYVLQRETYWKDVLQSRVFGYNNN